MSELNLVMFYLLVGGVVARVLLPIISHWRNDREARRAVRELEKRQGFNYNLWWRELGNPFRVFKKPYSLGDDDE